MNANRETPGGALGIALKSQRLVWLFMTVAAFTFGGVLLVVALAAVAASPGSPAWLIFGAVVAAGAAWGLVGGRLALRLTRARPRLVVSAEELVVEHPGLLRAPLVIRRSDVEAVCLGTFVGYRHPPDRGAGSRWRRLRAYSRWLDSGDTALTVEASANLPDFSNVMGGHHPDVLVVLRRPYDLASLPRRGLGIFLATETGPFEVPERGAKIRGLLATASDLDQARRAFSPWGVVRDTPTEEMLAWVSPSRGRQRGR